jgi:hypothetical protein
MHSAGSYFGQDALIASDPHSTNAVALNNCDIMVLTNADIFSAMERCTESSRAVRQNARQLCGLPALSCRNTSRVMSPTCHSVKNVWHNHLAATGYWGFTVTMCRKNPQQQGMHVGSVAAGPQQAALPPAHVETPDKETRARPVPIHRSEPSTAPGLPRSRADVTGSPRASPRSCLDTATSPASASSLRSPLERIEQLLELLINKARCDFAAWEPGLTLCNTCI